MNCLVSTNLDSVSPEKLPPRQRGSRTRILFISSVGLGFRRYYEQMIHYAGLDPDIDAVHIEVRQPLAVKLFCASVPVMVRRGWDQKSLRYHLAWWPILRRWFRGPLNLDHFDVVHITHGISLGFVGAPQARAKFALNVDVTAVQDYRELGYSHVARMTMVAAEREMYRAADLVVCRNRWACGSVINDFGTPQERTHVALSSLPLPPRSRADFPPHEGLPRIAFVGHQFERKGGPELLRLHQQRFVDRAELHIFSGGALPDHSARNVVWHGGVPNETLRNEILPTMDLFVFPTRHDMSPWAVIEAAGAGLPIVSTKIGAIPEMVKDQESGFLCDVNDWESITLATDRLLADAALRDCMGRAARQHMQSNYNPNQEFPGLMTRLKQLAVR
jgi:glycosyltransferase involved in cell wall biosynthesis